MNEKLQSRCKKYYGFCLIIGAMMMCYYLFLFFHFIDGRIYFGEKPYMFGVNSSVLFVDIINWIGIASGGMMGIGGCSLLLSSKRPWCLSEERKIGWICMIGGMICCIYGGYQFFKYQGRELYCDTYPIPDSAGKPYVIDVFLYVPLAVVTVATLWSSWRLYHLHRKKWKGESHETQ